MSESDISYSCGSCGYPLNLASSNQITAGVGSKYDKDLKKGFTTFLSVDLSRFTQVDEVTCFPVCWGRNHLQTKLLCRKCGAHIGYGYRESPILCGFHSPDSSRSSHNKFTVKILAIQPSGNC
ncbi:uncharacterized protein At4g08330, chloroplastic-like isoform X1 [Rhodamnia argentea]|uniref:Uncharacterized protein At4g08330, chloroplastic-like isoform X1 n=1 Tax=Rhodamnia argentea TaxID=178133 RepID=A0A8B8NHR5_9MYRT|nr:uncharacterized protein At4g08330, chloroplastic-like isoform X1 [Rhodamnia argentea]